MARYRVREALIPGARLTPQQKYLRTISEAAFARKILELAELTGWWWHHTRPAWDAGKFKTPLGGMKGFPDYVLANDGRASLARAAGPSYRVLFVELKKELGLQTHEQKEWARRLEPTGQYRLWRPSDWPSIEKELAPALFASRIAGSI